MISKERLRKSARRTANSFLSMIPVFLGVFLLTGLVVKLIPWHSVARYFSKNSLLDSLFGALVGSVSAGNPTASYVLAGELLENGVSLVAVTALIVSWVTVGVVQLPAEAVALGRRFAVWRNLVSFVFSIIIALLVVETLRLAP